jgi:hypothetical protein
MMMMDDEDEEEETDPQADSDSVPFFITDSIILIATIDDGLGSIRFPFGNNLCITVRTSSTTTTTARTMI